VASPLSRTIRSVALDHFYLSVAGLVIAIVFAIIWGKWFFTAKVTFYESTQHVYVTGDETIVSEFPQEAKGGTQRAVSVRTRRIIAEFPPEARERIQIGQPAFLALNTSVGKQTGPLEAVVVAVVDDDKKRVLRVEITAMLDAERPNPFEEGAPGEVRVESQYITPVALVMRASGLFTDAPPASFSPQNVRQFN
jgi:hypothetical protein